MERSPGVGGELMHGHPSAAFYARPGSSPLPLAAAPSPSLQPPGSSPYITCVDPSSCHRFCQAESCAQTPEQRHLPGIFLWFVWLLQAWAPRVCHLQTHCLRS